MFAERTNNRHRSGTLGTCQIPSPLPPHQRLTLRFNRQTDGVRLTNGQTNGRSLSIESVGSTQRSFWRSEAFRRASPTRERGAGSDFTVWPGVLCSRQEGHTIPPRVLRYNLIRWLSDFFCLVCFSIFSVDEE